MATSVATPLERRLGTIAGVNEMTSSSSIGSTRISLQFDLEPQHRRRRARGAGGDQRVARRPAGDAAQQPDLPQGEPVGRAGDHPRADLEDEDAGPDLRRGVEHRAASGWRRSRASATSRSAAARCRRCASSCCRSRSTSYGISTEDVRAAIQASNANRPKGAIEGDGRRLQIYTPDAGAARQPTTRRWSSPGATAPRCGCSDVAEVDRRRREHAHAGPVQRRAGGHRAGHAPARRQRHRDGRRRARAAARAAGRSCRPDVEARRSPPTARNSIRASLHEIELTLLISVVAGRAGRQRVPAQRARDASMPAVATVVVAARHLRRDVPARLQSSTT